MRSTGMRRAEIEETFERYGPMVYRRARAILGNDEEAREFMQDVFIKILSAGMKREGAASAWLNRVTTNECITRIRDKTRRAALLRRNLTTDEPADPNPEDRAIVRALLGEV